MKVVLLMAQTLDGKIARDAEHFPDWTGSADKRLFVQLTRKAGVVIMGSKTFDTIGKPLPGRKNIVMSRNPARQCRQDNLQVTSTPPKKIIEALQQEGYEEVMVIGGATINTLFAKESLIDELVLTISPIIFGTGLSLFEPDIAMALHLEDMEQLGKDRILVRYTVIK